ncbi:MAG: PorV/PorQ family protein [Candidatus Eisenbacteria bacterium]|uniref:PorV/PorQ family protein n=1 Tax=Eiseniibacteriota bacterium TaxID=2212470 RepID=A0A849SI06_UNCEI|nr:PorV/PorQ family protein [Candidatus Eisenbacteria bacterium]
MKANRTIALAAVLLALGAGAAWAGSENRVGTGGLHELRLPVGARSTALAGADIGSVSGAEALFYNPSGIAGTDRGTELMFSNTSYIAGTDVNFVGVTQSLGDLGMIGISAKVFSVGEIERTTETSPDGTGEFFSPTTTVIGLGYGKRMTDRVNFGGAFYFASERILQETASGVSFDFGFQYDTGYRGLKLGMAMKNFGPNSEFSGADFERNIRYDEDDPQSGNRTVTNNSSLFELPSLFQLGLSMPLVQGPTNLNAHALFQSNSFGRDEGRFGMELAVRNLAALRAGYVYNGDDESLFGLSYGVGVNVPLGSTRLAIDYAGQTINDGIFDDIQHVAVSLLF